MTTTHHDRKQRYFGEFVGLKWSDSEKAAFITYLKVVLGFSSAVKEVDEVAFLRRLMLFAAITAGTDVNNKIKKSFEDLSSEHKRSSTELEKDHADAEEDASQSSPATYESFQLLLRLLFDVYTIYNNDKSTPTLSDSVAPLWKYLREKVEEWKRTNLVEHLTSLECCFAWASQLKPRRSKAPSMPSSAAGTVKLCHQQAPAYSGASSATKSAERGEQGVLALPEGEGVGGYVVGAASKDVEGNLHRDAAPDKDVYLGRAPAASDEQVETGEAQTKDRATSTDGGCSPEPFEDEIIYMDEDDLESIRGKIRTARMNYPSMPPVARHAMALTLQRIELKLATATPCIGPANSPAAFCPIHTHKEANEPASQESLDEAENCLRNLNLETH